jgi:hypothetical protein
MPHALPALLVVAFVQTHLALDVEVAYSPPRVHGTATLTLENRSREPQATIPLLLNRLMTISAVRDGSGRVLPVTSDVVIFEDVPTWQALAAQVSLPGPVLANERVTIAVEFGGPLVGYTETGMLYVRDRIHPDFTILRTDALAFPSVGVPLAAANRTAPRADFGFEAGVTVPATSIVATGGELRDRAVRGDRVTFTYAGARVPFLNIAIAPFTTVERSGIRIHALPEDAPRAEAVARATENALVLFERWFGPPPSRPTITVIEIPEGFGSQASATGGVLLDAAAFKDSRQLPQLYHEVSHFWNVPDGDVPSPRWNEGLATYLQYRVASELDGFTGTAEAIERTRVRVCGRVKENDPVARVPFIRYGDEALTDWSYGVGLLMFAALERTIGRERLDAGLRAYVQRYLENGGTTRELMETLDAAAPQDLGPFFDEWLLTTRWTRQACGVNSQRGEDGASAE